ARLRACGPLPEIRQRVDRMAAGLPRPLPDLEVEMRPGGVARRSNLAEELTAADLLAGVHDRGAREHVHERVPVALPGLVHNHVVAGAAGLVGDEGDGARGRRDDRRAARRDDVLALVDVARAGRAEAAVGA